MAIASSMCKVWPETEKKDGHCTARQIEYYLRISEARYRKHLTFLENEGYVEAYSTRCLGQKRTEIVTLKEFTDTAETAPAGLWDVVANPDYPITAKVVYAYLALSAVPTREKSLSADCRTILDFPQTRRGNISDI